MSRLPSYSHFTDDELLRECDQHCADGLVVELSNRWFETGNALQVARSEVEELSGLRDRVQYLENELWQLKQQSTHSV